jgi:hypothetical protein
MNLPEITNTNFVNFLNSKEIIQETVDQIMKDFGLFGIVIVFSGNTAEAYAELHPQLVRQITFLLDSDISRFLSVMYQVDISEKDIVKTANELPDYNHVEVVAHQIIVRDLKKVLTRHYFKSQAAQNK